MGREWRFLACWAGMLALFWVIVFSQVSASHQSPQHMAAARLNYDGGTEVVWRYTGPRPQEGEVLRVGVRQGDHYDRQRVRVIAFLGGTQMPDHRELHATGERTEATSYLERSYTEIQPWPEEQELWVGIRFARGARIWHEAGDPAFSNLQERPYKRLSDQSSFSREGYDWFSSVEAVVAPADSEPVPVSRPLTLAIVYTLLLLPALFVLPGYRRWWVVGAAFHVVLLVKVLEVMFSSQWWWGGYYVARYGSNWFWGGLVLLQLLIFPGILSFMSDALRPVYALVYYRLWRPWFFWPAGLVSAALGLWIAMTYTSLGIYGDGYGSLSNPGYDYHNPFATAIFHAFRDFFFWAREYGYFTRVQPRLADMGIIQIFVSLHAPVYIFFVGLVARELGRSRREAVLIFLGFCMLKPVLTLLGYIEVYGPALVVQAILVWLVLRAFRRREVLLPTGWSFFAYLFHMSGALVLPVILGLWLRGFLAASAKIRWLFTRAGAVGILAIQIWLICLGTLLIYKHDLNLKSFRDQVPAPKSELFADYRWFHGLPMLYGSTGLPKSQVFLNWKQPMHFTHFYLLTSWEHASQYGGAVLFNTGPLMLLIPLSLLLARRRAWRNIEFYSLQGASALFVVGAGTLATSFPYPKDWDVLTVQTIWWVTTLYWMITRGGILPTRAARWLLAALFFYFFWDSLGWIFYNLNWGPPPDQRYFAFV